MRQSTSLLCFGGRSKSRSKSKEAMSMTCSDRSLKKKSKKSSKHSSDSEERLPEYASPTLSESLSRIRLGHESPASQRSSSSSSKTVSSHSLSRRSKKSKEDEIEMGIKNVEMVDEATTINTVEVLKRPGQTLGFYIREGNGKTTKKGVYVSRIAEGSVIQRNGLLKVGDEIRAINSVDVTRTNLDDVVVLMSIPKKLVLQIKSQRIPANMHRASARYSVPQAVYVPKESSDSESLQNYLTANAEINTEGSNDSGLSSEHSIKGEVRHENKNYDLPLPPPEYQAIEQPPALQPICVKPSKPKPQQRSDLYASDGEHDYCPAPRRAIRQPDSLHRQLLKGGGRDGHVGDGNCNSDSELLTRLNNFGTQPKSQQISYGDNYNNSPVLAQPYPPVSSAGERLSSFGKTSPYWSENGEPVYGNYQKTNATKSDVGYSTNQKSELDSYRNELWKQEKMLNDVIQNMESALTVDTLLQQPTTSSGSNMLLGSLPRNTSVATSAYTYLRELPLLIKTPMRIHIDEFNLYRPEHDQSNTSPTSLPPGSMKVKIYCGHGLKSSRTILRDLYCVLQIDSEKRSKSMIRTGAINFDWDEVFSLELDRDVQDLVCLIYHWDPNSRHKLCFTGAIKLTNILNVASNSPQDVKCALKLEPRGILYLELSYCKMPDEGLQPTYLFGAHLKDTLATERNDLHVPVMLQKCVTEINNRGLGTVGLYRLCGAAKKKNQLRQEFEKHPNLVDLSEQNVPEIHVITGLMKDYLRELPDPVISELAFSVIERALTQESADEDSEQDCIETVNEFVASLHPWQQGTVVFLLNHLKQVANHCADNRMSSSNLAVCFAPIFNCLESEDKDVQHEANNMKVSIDVVRYLLDVWPLNYTTNNNIII